MNARGTRLIQRRRRKAWLRLQTRMLSTIFAFEDMAKATHRSTAAVREFVEQWRVLPEPPKT